MKVFDSIGDLLKTLGVIFLSILAFFGIIIFMIVVVLCSVVLSPVAVLVLIVEKIFDKKKEESE